MNKKVLLTALFCTTLFFNMNSVDAKHESTPNIAIIATNAPVENESTNKEPSIKDRISLITGGTKDTSTISQGHLYIPKDTKIQLQLIDSVSSKKSKKGQTFRLKTTNNLLIENTPIILKDSEVSGYVVDAHGNGLFGRGGSLKVNIPEIKTINNVSVPLNGYVNGYGANDNGAVAVAAVVTLVGGLFMRGENIYYEPGQLFEVSVAADTDIQATPDTLKTVMNPSIIQGQSIQVLVKN